MADSRMEMAPSQESSTVNTSTGTAENIPEALLELQEAETKVVRALQIAANICATMGENKAESSVGSLKEDMGEYLRIIKEVHASVEPKIKLLSAYEPPKESSYNSEITARLGIGVSRQIRPDMDSRRKGAVDATPRASLNFGVAHELQIPAAHDVLVLISPA
eukprot:CAMPEP_0171911638 /NCGR_PEP_ID=MMETSP0993-20121228/10437_1 /TAXON_ID=483369 /ORGANISM="non described non described, Strain CCMP2098" /LENGTH=162 /DNA_ID=CAMNT_0012545195 /DNA_START=6 /DNA_END=495 /DNA_ORIENTATION=+